MSNFWRTSDKSQDNSDLSRLRHAIDAFISKMDAFFYKTAPIAIVCPLKKLVLSALGRNQTCASSI